MTDTQKTETGTLRSDCFWRDIRIKTWSEGNMEFLALERMPFK